MSLYCLILSTLLCTKHNVSVTYKIFFWDFWSFSLFPNLELTTKISLMSNYSFHITVDACVSRSNVMYSKKSYLTGTCIPWRISIIWDGLMYCKETEQVFQKIFSKNISKSKNHTHLHHLKATPVKTKHYLVHVYKGYFLMYFRKRN